MYLDIVKQSILAKVDVMITIYNTSTLHLQIRPYLVENAQTRPIL